LGTAEFNKRKFCTPVSGGYMPHYFLIELDPDAPFFAESGDKHTFNMDYAHVFTHEYFHYLQNISTVWGFWSLNYTQEMLAILSKAVCVDAGNLTVDPGRLDDNDVLDARGFMALFDALSGDASPRPVWNRNTEIRVKVIDTKPDSQPFKVKGRAFYRQAFILDVEVDDGSGASATDKMTLGATAIAESVAYLVETYVREVKGMEPEEFPEFPYRVLDRLYECKVGTICDSRWLLARLGTLALMSINPGMEICRIMDDLILERAVAARRDP